jgi:hypothetical protein
MPYSTTQSLNLKQWVIVNNHIVTGYQVQRVKNCSIKCQLIIYIQKTKPKRRSLLYPSYTQPKTIAQMTLLT